MGATLVAQGRHDDGGVNSFPGPTFTPSSNVLLVAMVAAVISNGSDESANLTWTSTGSLTWTARGNGGVASSFREQGRIWTAPVGTSPGSISCTGGCSSGPSIYNPCWTVWEVSGYDTGTPTAAKIVTSSTTFDGALSITLDASPASSSIVLAMVGVDGDSSGTVGVTAGSGWSADGTAGTVNSYCQGQQRTSSTSTTVAWADIQTGTMPTYSSVGLALEVKMTGGGTDVPTSATASFGMASSASPTHTATVAATAAIGLASSASPSHAISLAATATIGLAPTASPTHDVATSASSAHGVAATAAATHDVPVTAAAALGVAASANSSHDAIVTAVATLAVTGTAGPTHDAIVTALAELGLAAVAGTVTRDSPIAANVTLGLAAIAVVTHLEATNASAALGLVGRALTDPATDVPTNATVSLGLAALALPTHDTPIAATATAGMTGRATPAHDAAITALTALGLAPTAASTATARDITAVAALGVAGVAGTVTRSTPVVAVLTAGFAPFGLPASNRPIVAVCTLGLIAQLIQTGAIRAADVVLLWGSAGAVGPDWTSADAAADWTGAGTQLSWET